MSNHIVSVIVPAQDGWGSFADVSILAPEKNITVGGFFTGQILLEASLDAGFSYNPIAIVQPNNVGAEAIKINAVCQFIRARKIGTTIEGAPTLFISGLIATNNFEVLEIPSIDGAGALVDISTWGPQITVAVSGPFDGALIVEASNDDNVWNAILRFEPGQVIQNYYGTFKSVRIRRVYTTDAALPIATIGASSLLGGGGSSNAINVGVDLDDVIKSRAYDVLGFSQFTYWSDPFITSPGREGSLWKIIGGPGVRSKNNAPSGVIRIGGGTYNGIIIDPYNVAGYPFEPIGDAPSVVGPLSEMNAHYMFWRFRLEQSESWGPDCSLIMGMIDATTLGVYGGGIGFGQSGFGGVGGNVNGGANLTQQVVEEGNLPLDYNWHNLEIYRRIIGSALWLWVRYDGNPWIQCLDVLEPSMERAVPFCQIMTTLDTSGELPVVDIDHVAMAIINNNGYLDARTLGPT